MHVHLDTRFKVGDARACDPAAVVQESDDLRCRDACGAERGGGAREDEREAGIVDLRVVEADAAVQGVFAQARYRAQAGAAGEMTVAWHRRMESCEGVVEEQPGAEEGAVPRHPPQRHQDRHRVHQMGRDLLDQQTSLLQRLAYQLDVELLQIAQTAMDQFAGTAGRSGRPVPLLDHGDPQPAARSVKGDAAAGGAAADDEHVEEVGGEALERRRPLRRSERCGVPAARR